MSTTEQVAASVPAAGERRRIRVVHVITGLGVGGAERALARLVTDTDGWKRFDHCVVSLTSLGVVGAELLAAGVPVHAVGLRSAFGAPSAILRLRRVLGDLRPDVVQTWMYHADFLGGLASRWSGVAPVVWGVRATSMIEGTSRTTAAIRRICSLLSARVPAAIVCAAESARREHAAIGYDERRMVVIANGVDVGRYWVAEPERTKLRASCGWTDANVVVGCIGRFNPYKDYRTFLRAAALLARDAPHVRFLMVGRGLDAANRELAGWIAATGIADRIALIGERSDVYVCLAAMDVFCLSSRCEGFPNVVAEAMAAGLPCAVTDAGDAARIVGDAGLVVPPRAPGALAAALLQHALLSREERAKLGARARDRVTACFSLQRCREQYEALYESVVARHDGAAL